MEVPAFAELRRGKPKSQARKPNDASREARGTLQAGGLRYVGGEIKIKSAEGLRFLAGEKDGSIPP